MPPVFVSENIARIENAIGRFTDELSHLEKRKEEIKIERTRLEGCLITFEGFARAGIEEIVPEHEKNQRDSQKECDQGEDESHTDTHEQGGRESHTDTHEQGGRESHTDTHEQGERESHTDTHEQGERESCSDPRAHTHEQGERESCSDPRDHTHEQGERESCSDPRDHTHEQKHVKTPLEELYAKYRTM